MQNQGTKVVRRVHGCSPVVWHDCGVLHVGAPNRASLSMHWKRCTWMSRDHWRKEYEDSCSGPHAGGVLNAFPAPGNIKPTDIMSWAQGLMHTQAAWDGSERSISICAWWISDGKRKVLGESHLQMRHGCPWQQKWLLPCKQLPKSAQWQAQYTSRLLRLSGTDCWWVHLCVHVCMVHEDTYQHDYALMYHTFQLTPCPNHCSGFQPSWYLHVLRDMSDDCDCSGTQAWKIFLWDLTTRLENNDKQQKLLNGLMTQG